MTTLTDAQRPGRIVLLNGTSSSGKTTRVMTPEEAAERIAASIPLG